MKDRVVSAIAGALIALLLAWPHWNPEPVKETAAPEQHLPSGGLVLARDPDAPVPAPVKKAAKEAGGDLERAISITVQPDPVVPEGDGKYADPMTPAPPACSCKPITVDLGLIEMKDHTHRVVATAEGGEIVAALDRPFGPAVSKRETRWAAGVAFAPFPDEQGRKYGAWVDRDVGPLRLGAEVQFAPGFSHPAAWARAGVRF
jgi:hypothetical protein